MSKTNTEMNESEFPSEMPAEEYGHVLRDLFRAIGLRMVEKCGWWQKWYIRKYTGPAKGRTLSFDRLDAMIRKIGRYRGTEVAAIDSGTPQWQEFQVLLSGILSVMNREPVNALATASRDENDRYAREHLDRERRALAGSWGIFDEERALRNLLWLLTGGHAGKYEQLLTQPRLADTDDEGERQQYDFAQHFSERYTPSQMRAWDIGRAANVVRWCYTAGYLDRETAWGCMDYIGRLAVSGFGSFAGFAQSYAFGRLFWLWKQAPGERLYPVYHLLRTINRLFDPEKGAWRLHPWPQEIDGEAFDAENHPVFAAMKERHDDLRQNRRARVLRQLVLLGPMPDEDSDYDPELPGYYVELLDELEGTISMEEGRVLISIMPKNRFEGIEEYIGQLIGTIELADEDPMRAYEKRKGYENLITSCPNEEVRNELITGYMMWQENLSGAYHEFESPSKPN